MAERKPGRFPASQAPSCPVDAGSAHSPRMRVVCRNASAIAAIGSSKGALPPMIHLFMRIDVRDRAALLPCGRHERFIRRGISSTAVPDGIAAWLPRERATDL